MARILTRLLALLAVGLGLGTAVWTARAAAQATRPVYYIRTNTKAMALTFDVSWGETMLPKVLAVLRQYHQPATFFLSAPWAKTRPELVKAIREAGDEIASHGQAHVNLGGLPAATIAANIRSADAVLRSYDPSAPLRFFRPPNGDWSPRSVRVASALGYETVIWSIDSRDWLNPGVTAIVQRVVRGAFPGAIILLHASDTCRQTDLALPAIIDQLRAEGYQLVTLGKLWSLGEPARDDPRGSGHKPNTAPSSSAA